MSENKFTAYHLEDTIIKALDILNYTEPTDVQKKVLPILLNGTDVVVHSQTGSGKTGAFGIPMCEMIEWEERAPQVLVLTPTRELAIQIKDELFNIGRYKRLKVECVFGKSSFENQVKQLKQRTHIVVATPGRLFDHIERGTIDLGKIRAVVIDEADEMFAMGFIEQIEEILDMLPYNRTTALFSATMPEKMKALTTRYLNEPRYIEVKSENKVQDRIEQSYVSVSGDEKVSVIESVLITEQPTSSILFCNTKVMVEKVTTYLRSQGIMAKMLHGGMEQRDRTKVIKDYKRGYFRFLVATDVAARGLDIADIPLVINVDVPDKPATYVHRIGRTARFKNTGKAISLVNQGDTYYFDDIQKKQEHPIPVYPLKATLEVEDLRATFMMLQREQPTLRKEKAQDFKEDILKLHINAGKKTKMRPGDVVGALCQIEGMTAADIGVITLLDISTFVEILNGKGEHVYQTLQNMPIKGRMRRVNKANETNYERDLKEQRES